MAKELETNTTLSHYRIVSKIGAGGMGEVYLAQDTSELGRRVALKILPTAVAADHDRLQRFIQEARTVSNLNHPNILTVYEFGQTESATFMATEYVDGVTLRQHLANRRLKLGDVLEVAMQIVAALNAAHEAGVTHRDLKPENVMVRRDQIVKVLDFGLAKLSEPAAAGKLSNSNEEADTKILRTEPGLVMGTVGYMSPEQSMGKAVDPRTDIWSAGVVLYEMIAGRLPFAGKDIHRQIIAIQEAEPAPLAQQVEGVPERLEEIVGKCLAKEKEERYQTAKDLLIDLRNLRRRLEVEAEIERSVAPASRATSSGGASGAGTQLTPAGVGATGAAAVPPTSSAEYLVSEIRQHKRGVAAVLLALLLAASGLGFWYVSTRSSSAKPIESIAVMPFVNESGNPDTEYLSDGMTETLIGSLSQVPNLNVKSRSSVFRYKGKETSAQTIGKELNVQAILNGRVVQRGDGLTLSLELVDAATENAIWSESYNRKQTDLVALQSEIARDVSGKLKAKLSGVDEVNVAKTATTNPEAYQLYLKGRFYWNKRTGESLKQAVEFFNQAVKKDPNYALAYSGLAENYVLFPNYSVASPLDSMPKAKAAALRAIELNDSLAETHVALGIYYSNFAWNQPAAENEFRRAIELNPNYATAHQQFGIECLATMGRFDEAIAEGKRAEELDPVSPIIGADLGNILMRARRFDESLAQLHRVLTLDPNFYVTYWYLGMAYYGKGHYADAVAAYRKALALNDNPWVKALLIQSLTRSGERSEAVKLLRELEAESARRYVANSNLAIAYGSLGEKEKAFALLDKDVADRSSRPQVFSINPIWDDLRDDPRFAALIRKVEQAKLD